MMIIQITLISYSIDIKQCVLKIDRLLAEFLNLLWKFLIHYAIIGLGKDGQIF